MREPGRPNVCFLGGARYGNPLDATNAAKFTALEKIAELTVIAFSADYRFETFRQHARFVLLPNVRLRLLRYALMFTVAPWIALSVIVRSNIDVLVCQSPYEGAIGVAVKRLAALGGQDLRVVVESHGDFENALFLQHFIRSERLYRRLMGGAARIAFGSADAVRVISEATRKQVRSWAPTAPLVQFPAWTNIEPFMKAGERRTGVAREILYAGVVTPLKGVDNLIRAFSIVLEQVGDARLVIVGKRQDVSFLARLKEEIADLDLGEHVSFTGAVDQTDLAERMARSAVFVLPSHSEGLGRVVFEAMATGTPVVASRVGGIPELVSDGETGFLVAPGDESALADRLVHLLRNDEERERMGRAARAAAERVFSTEAYVDGYRRLIDAALDR